jgi:hypothetical protein
MGREDDPGRRFENVSTTRLGEKGKEEELLNLGHPSLPGPAESRDALLCGESGEQTGQESRSAGPYPQVDFICWTK